MKFLKKINFSWDKLFANKKVLIVISLLISITIWLTVSPERERTIVRPLTITTADTTTGELGLEVVSGFDQQIRVTVSGNWYTISNLSAEDIYINYSFRGIVTAGDYELELTASRATGAADFTVVRVYPSTVTVSVDHVSTSEFPVEVVTNNIETEEGLIVGVPILDAEESSISITGPDTELARIDRVVAEVNVVGVMSETDSFRVRIQLLNEGGYEMDTGPFTLPFRNVDVTIPINTRRVVPVRASFTGAPPYFARNEIRHRVSMREIALIGSAEALERIEEIELDPIDFRHITPQDYRFRINLALPTGVTTAGDIEFVTVRVIMDDFASRNFTVTRFVQTDRGEGGRVSVLDELKVVTVVGPQAVIEELSADDLYLEFSLGNITGATGAITVDATLRSDTHRNVWGTGESQIQLEVVGD